MKAEIGRFKPDAKYVGSLPSHAVYRTEDWEILGCWANALSFHLSLKSAERAARGEEKGGRNCTVVQFDYSDGDQGTGSD